MSETKPTVTSRRVGDEQQTMVIAIDDGRANALSTAASRSISDLIGQAEADPGIRSVVIVGRPGMLSGGFDLKIIASGDIDAVNEMVTVGAAMMAHVYGASVPVVAACTGHAVAAGSFLLMACDHRVGLAGDFKFVLNEVAIGMRLPDWAYALGEARLNRRDFQAVFANSRIYNPTQAVDVGFLDEVVPTDALADQADGVEAVLAVAIQEAERLAKLDPAAYAFAVRDSRSATLARMPSWK